MSISKRQLGVQGYKNPAQQLSKDAMEISKALEYLKYSPFKDGTVKGILQRGAKPLVENLQQEYLKIDPTKMGGDVSIFVDVKPARRRLDTVYIGPAKRISKGWQLWHILNFGTTRPAGKDGRVGIIPAKRFMDKAVANTKQQVIDKVSEEFEKAMHRLGKKLGFDTRYK